MRPSFLSPICPVLLKHPLISCRKSAEAQIACRALLLLVIWYCGTLILHHIRLRYVVHRGTNTNIVLKLGALNLQDLKMADQKKNKESRAGK